MDEAPAQGLTIRHDVPSNGTATNGELSVADKAALADILNLSALAGRSRIAKAAGKQFGGRRDIFAEAGYVPEDELKFKHYWAAYERGGIAGRIVDMPAKTTWRRPPELSIEGLEDSAFVDAFRELVKRLRLWNRLERVDRLGGVGRYAILFLGFADGEDDKVLKEPVNPLSSVNPDFLQYVAVYSEKNAPIQKLVTDTGDPRFGLPLFYDIQLTAGAGQSLGKTVVVHWSRVLHIAEDLLEDDVYGRPRLKRVMNRLADLEKVAASTGESFWQLAARVLTGKVDAGAEMSDAAFAKLGEDLQEIVHNLRRQFLGEGVELDWLGSTPPDPTGAADMYMTLIAAAAGIPKRILFGTETGDRASSQDERQWLGSVAERQFWFAEPDILRAFVDRMIALRVLPEPEEETYEVHWPALYQPTPQETAETNKTTAETAKALTPVGGDPVHLIRIDDDGLVYLRSTEELIGAGIISEDGGGLAPALPPDDGNPPDTDPGVEGAAA